MKYYLAIDLGATSGRHIISYEKNGKIVLEEIYRFQTGMDQGEDGLVWNIPRLFNEIKLGIKKAFEINKNIVSLSIDSWGVDYVLMNGDKELPPFYAYRNKRLDTSYKDVHNIISFEDLYNITGIQFAPYNTIYQLYSDLKSGRLESATDYLTIPEYFIYKLTGIKTHEYTFESTTGLLDALNKDYSSLIIEKLGLPKKLFKEISQPGVVVGRLSKEIENEVGGNLDVVLCASHDTASAFEAVDCPKDAVIISSGTWSLLGFKSEKPIINDSSKNANFTNEGGVGYIRFLKNIMGMWIANQASSQLNVDLYKICKELDDVEYKELFDVNDVTLLSPVDMSKAVIDLLKGREPKNNKELFASIFHSLAYSYNQAISELETITGIKYNYVYIVGGGAKNDYLNKLVAHYTNRKVVAMPIEATSIGNIMLQIKTETDK